MIDKALPMPRVTGKWNGDEKYPGLLWVPMSDGTRQAYARIVDQPGFHEREESHNGYQRKEAGS